MNIEQIYKAQAALKKATEGMTGEQLYAFSLLFDTRNTVAYLYKKLLRKVIKGCDSCYMDALIEVINVNIQSIMDKIKCQYALRAGALLQDRYGDDAKMCNNHTITNELAVYHLATNPGIEKLFTMFPGGWENEVKLFREKMQSGTPEVKPEIEVMEVEITDGGLIDTKKENEVAGIEPYIKPEVIEAPVPEKSQEPKYEGKKRGRKSRK